MFAEAVEIRDRLASMVDRLDPDAVSGTTARELWTVLDRSERLCAAGKTLLARRVADTHRPQTAGAKTAAEDLAHRAGTTSGAAKDAVATSKRLPEQPGVEGALRRGDLSPVQAAALSTAAAANPAEEARLVELASRVSLPELREECARVRAAADPDPDATNRRLHAGRRLRRWIGSDGFWTLHATGTPQAGAAFGAVLDAVTDQVFQSARRNGRTEPLEAYAFDALMALADHTADQPTTDGAGPDDGKRLIVPGRRGAVDTDEVSAGLPLVAPGHIGSAGTHEAGPDEADDSQPLVPAPRAPRMPRRWNPRYRALLRVDVTALHRGRVDGDELCEIAGVGPVPVSVAEGLLGHAVLHLVITRGTDVLNVTHLGPGPTAAQTVALAWRNPTCTVEGCWRLRTENDHREPWAVTQHTRLDELDPLCTFHHDLKTRHGWALVPGHGKRPIVSPDDPRHPRHRAGPVGGAGPLPPGANPAGAVTGAAGPSPSTATPRRQSRPAQPTLPDPPGDPPKAA